MSLAGIDRQTCGAHLCTIAGLCREHSQSTTVFRVPIFTWYDSWKRASGPIIKEDEVVIDHEEQLVVTFGIGS